MWCDANHRVPSVSTLGHNARHRAGGGPASPVRRSRMVGGIFSCIGVGVSTIIGVWTIDWFVWRFFLLLFIFRCVCFLFSLSLSAAAATGHIQRMDCYHGWRHWQQRGCKCPNVEPYPTSRRRWTNVGLMLVQRRRRWTKIKPGLVYFLALAGPPSRPQTTGLSYCCDMYAHTTHIRYESRESQQFVGPAGLRRRRCRSDVVSLSGNYYSYPTASLCQPLEWIIWCMWPILNVTPADVMWYAAWFMYMWHNIKVKKYLNW